MATMGDDRLVRVWDIAGEWATCITAVRGARPLFACAWQPGGDNLRRRTSWNLCLDAIALIASRWLCSDISPAAQQARTPRWTAGSGHWAPGLLVGLESRRGQRSAITPYPNAQPYHLPGNRCAEPRTLQAYITHPGYIRPSAWACRCSPDCTI